MSQAPKQRGMLITMVGPSGAGKNQLMNEIFARYEGHHPRVRQFPTATTRAMREGEEEGKQHHFVTLERFQEMIANNELLEWQLVHGNGNDRYYGMPRETLENAFEAGDILLADIEYMGARQVKELYPDNVVCVYIMPPSVSALIERIRHRRTESEGEISKRLLRVPAEVNFAPECDYVIVNDAFDEAATMLHSIVATEINHRNVSEILHKTLLNKFSFYVQIIPITDAKTKTPAKPAPHPEKLLRTDEDPFKIALALAHAAFDAEAQADSIITGERKEDDDYIPPVELSYDTQPEGERIIFTYYYLVKD